MAKINHFLTKEQILAYLKANPVWISAFTSGEGSFTASFMVRPQSMWGLLPQIEFNITQLMNDVLLLNAINEFFNNEGGVYSRQNGVGTVSFRKISVHKESIIPFFMEYPLIGSKSYEFERWVQLVNLLYEKKHVGDSLSNRDIFLDFAYICRELNAKRDNPAKIIRSDIIINWLKDLDGVPSQEQKLLLNNNLTKALNALKLAKFNKLTSINSQ
jgi:hypothetical protein